MNAGAESQAAPTAAPVRPRNARRFSAGIAGELARISRGCTKLSLVCAELVGRERLRKYPGVAALARLDSSLASIMRLDLKECDSLGHIADGRYALLLPGVGLSGARLHGEKLQELLADKIRPLHKNNGLKIACALGIVCVRQGEQSSAGDLLERGARVLQNALAQKSVHICQEQLALRERPTLVHSDEKRFLFFGEE